MAGKHTRKVITYMETITYYTQHWILLAVLSTIRGDQHSFDEKVKVLDQAITLLNHNFLQVHTYQKYLTVNDKELNLL